MKIRKGVGDKKGTGDMYPSVPGGGTIGFSGGPRRYPESGNGPHNPKIWGK